ncbi:MAG: tRNA (adenosine(37)-N6)-threonylcarbamoyltransferase complex dimerization subunit type 1 TsaB [Sphingopyxis sp.]|nr:tRNA (adenosine(37)-N6)-threonylcarbamoyltransferase complex dimerization subunit type 1 TsaB [Sphingopyxis sp.]
MRTLVIDTATKACSVAHFEGETLRASHLEVIGRGHAERLLPLIAQLPDKGKADQIFVNVGPGSFTGIRIGVAAAKALGLAWGVPVHGYGCLALVAAMAREEYPDAEQIDVLMTGGHGEYFFGAFDTANEALGEIISIKPAQIDDHSTSRVIAGDVDVSGPGRTWVDLLPDAQKWHLLRDATALKPSPVYGRPPDAKPALVAT